MRISKFLSRSIVLAVIGLITTTANAQNAEANLQALFAKSATESSGNREYVPTEENLQARKEFEQKRFGIFIHWGYYSMPGQGEWVLTRSNVPVDEYLALASAFYPSKFNAKEWIDLFKEAGAKYMCITSRHHDGFSMFDSKYTDYDIVDATPFKRDILKELADECHKQDFGLNLYYSHVDWYRDDYPTGWSANEYNNLKKHEGDYASYYKFMNNQLTELLTNYGKIGGIWFDGVFDHRRDSMDWHFPEQFDMVHKLQPTCLIASNHHRAIQYGEDFQIFERDLPGENKSGFGNAGGVSELPLETCQQIVNGSWGYHLNKMDCKSPAELIVMLISTAGKGANLLLNIGPRPNGTIPEPAAESLRGLGKWLDKYGETIYGTKAGDLSGQSWGSTTRKGDKLYVHITNHPGKDLYMPLDCKVKSAKMFIDGSPVKFDQWKHGIQLQLPDPADGEPIMVIELTTTTK